MHDLPETVASKQVVHDRYKDLTEVEMAFRTSKTVHLEMREASSSVEPKWYPARSMPIRRSRYSAACARETRLSPPRCCSTVKSRRVPNSDSKVRRVRPAKSLPGALRRNSCAHLGSHFLQATAGRSLSRRGQQLRPGDYAMARPRGRRGGTAGHHPHRSADERAAPTGVSAFLVAGRPFQH